MSTTFITVRNGAAYRVVESGRNEEFVTESRVILLARHGREVDWRTADHTSRGRDRIFAGQEPSIDEYLRRKARK